MGGGPNDQGEQLLGDSLLGARVYVCFFFSSRRRHTRSKRDWSSDVCSSDLELERSWKEARADPRYREELTELLRTYAGRPTPLFRADRLAKALGLSGRVYLKREDLLHTGAHKLNNKIGRASCREREEIKADV